MGTANPSQPLSAYSQETCVGEESQGLQGIEIDACAHVHGGSKVNNFHVSWCGHQEIFRLDLHIKIDEWAVSSTSAVLHSTSC